MFRNAFLKPALFVIAASSFVAACDGNQNQITWTKASVAQREAALTSASAWGSFEAGDAWQKLEIDHNADASCPSLTQVGAKLTYAADGCVGRSGHKYTGKAEITQVDATERSAVASMDLNFVGFSMEKGDHKIALEGTFHWDRDNDKKEKAISNISITRDAVALRFDTEVDCDATGHCVSTEDSRGTVDELGEFKLETQTYPKGEGLVNVLILHGTDNLSLSSAKDQNGCYRYSLDGHFGGRLCL